MNQTLVIGIDLGNSNCSLSYFMPEVEGAQSTMVPLENIGLGLSPNILPTAVWFPFDGSEPRIGTPALNADDKKGRLFANFKKQLMEEAEPRAVITEGIKKSAVDALTTLLGHLARQAASHGELNKYFILRQEQWVPKEPIYLTLGVPTQALEHYKDRLRRACVASGWLTEEQVSSYLSFVAEPIGAALNYAPGKRKCFFVYDHGGLTLDMVRIQVDESQTPPYKVMGESKERVTCTIQGRSYDVGGSVLDRLLLRFILTRAGGVSALQTKIMEAYDAEFDPILLEKLVQMESDPPNSGNESRVYARLCRDIGRARVALSSPEGDTVFFFLNVGLLPTPTKIVIKKVNLDEAFRDVIQAIRQKLPKDVGPDDYCYMVGGCSLTPQLETLLKETFGDMRVLLANNPMEMIALGLSKYYRVGIVGVDDDTDIVDDNVDTDYGVWNSESHRYDVVLAKGTAYSEAFLPKSGIPGADKGIFRVYQPVKPSTEITLRVGQRDATGEWIKLDERTVHLPTPTTYFRIYFAIDRELGQLEMRLSSTETKKLIPLENPTLSLPKINSK